MASPRGNHPECQTITHRLYYRTVSSRWNPLTDVKPPGLGSGIRGPDYLYLTILFHYYMYMPPKLDGNSTPTGFSL